MSQMCLETFRERRKYFLLVILTYRVPLTLWIIEISNICHQPYCRIRIEKKSKIIRRNWLKMQWNSFIDFERGKGKVLFPFELLLFWYSEGKFHSFERVFIRWHYALHDVFNLMFRKACKEEYSVVYYLLLSAIDLWVSPVPMETNYAFTGKSIHHTK